MTTTTRQSRESGTRSKQWQRPSQLETPEPKGDYVYRWVRTETKGESDDANIQYRMQEHGEIVHPDEIPSMMFSKNTAEGKGVASIRRKDLVLMKFPKEVFEQRKEYYAKLADAQVQGVADQFLQKGTKEMPTTREFS